MSRRAYISKVIQDVRASYWFVPTLFVFGAIALAQIVLFIDRNAADLGLQLPRAWRTTQVDGARATLSVIAQSMIGVTGVMFSITIVAVSFASGNFGPRLIGNFMRDRGTQFSLGILVATFIFGLSALKAVQAPVGTDGAGFVPHLAVAVGLSLTLLSVLVMIYYIHHVPELINVSNISANIGQRLKCAIEDRIDAHIAAQDKTDGSALTELPKTAYDINITAQGCGYIQTWDKADLAVLANHYDIYLDILHEAGAFVSEASTLLSVRSDQPLSEETRQALVDCFALGKVATETQNLDFLVDQLVEMIARALSPGVNDPYTAINCLNWLYVGAIAAGSYKGGLKPQTMARLRFASLTFDTIIDRAFRQAAPYIKDDPLARAHLLSLLDRLEQELENPAHCHVISDLRGSI